MSFDIKNALLVRLRGGLHERELLLHHPAGALDLAILLDELLVSSRAIAVSPSSTLP
jgi:hypothetical protein